MVYEANQSNYPAQVAPSMTGSYGAQVNQAYSATGSNSVTYTIWGAEEPKTATQASVDYSDWSKQNKQAEKRPSVSAEAEKPKTECCLRGCCPKGQRHQMMLRAGLFK